MSTETDANFVDESPEEQPQSLQLEVDIIAPTACERHVKVTVAREDVDRYFDEAVGELMEDAQVPGFRPGRAPRKLVESQFRKDLSEKVKVRVLMDSMAQVTEEADFSAISEADMDLDAVELPDEGPLTFEFDIEVRPEFDLPKWKGLKLDRPSRTFTKKDIDNHLAKMDALHAAMEPVDGPAEMGDVLALNVRFHRGADQIGRLDDIEVRLRPELSFEDAIMADFGELMVGTKAGDKRTAKITIGNHVENESLRGAEVNAEFEVLDVKRLGVPEITDSFLKSYGFDTEGELRDAVEGELERQLRYAQNQSIRRQISELLTVAADWELPPGLLKRQANRELQRAVMELRSSGFSEEQIRMHANSIRQNSAESTAKALKEHFILERIAEEEELEATDVDYELEIARIAAQSRESARSVRARLEKQGLMDALRNQIIENMAIDLIKQEATFVDVPVPESVDRTTAIEFAIAGSAAAIPEAKHGGDAVELPQPIDRS